MGQKIANAPLGSFSVKTIYSNGDAIQEVQSGALLSIRIDEGTTYNYYGWALPGTLESAESWRIGRFTNANVSGLQWADGNTNFDNIWNNRSSLIYS